MHENTRIPVVVRVSAFVCAASVPFDIVQLLGERTITALTSLVFVASWGVWRAKAATVSPIPAWWVGAVTFYIAWTLATSLWSVAPDLSTNAAFANAFQVILAFAYADVVRCHLVGVLRAYTAGVTFLGILILDTGTASEKLSDRTNFLGADENFTAFVLCVGVASVLFLARQSKRRLELLMAGGAVAVMATATVQLGSRTGLVVLGVLALTAGTMALFQRRGKSGFRMGILAVVGGGVYALMNVELPRRLALFLASPTAVDPERARISDLFAAEQDRWALFGVGLGADAHFLQQVQGQFAYAHNAFMQTWIQLGVVGLALLLILLLGVLVRSFAYGSRALTALIVSPFALFFYSLGGQRETLTWLFIGVLLGSSGVSARVDAENARESLRREAQLGARRN